MTPDRSHGERRWRACGRDGLACRILGDAALIYDRRSGQTHCLNALALAALDLLDGTERDAAGLAQALAERVETPPGTDLAAVAEAAIAGLDRLGLIVPAGP